MTQKELIMETMNFLETHISTHDGNALSSLLQKEFDISQEDYLQYLLTSGKINTELYEALMMYHKD